MIDVKRDFVFADRLKGGRFDSRQAFLDSFESCKEQVAALSETEIDSAIGIDPRRLQDYNRASWKSGTIELGQCVVWPGMGGVDWAAGSPLVVAEMFRRKGPQDSKVWSMRLFAGLFTARLPIIILDSGLEVRIDDGSHRAVAMALEGFTQVTAWIGVLRGEPSSRVNGHQPLRF